MERTVEPPTRTRELRPGTINDLHRLQKSMRRWYGMRSRCREQMFSAIEACLDARAGSRRAFKRAASMRTDMRS